MPHSSQHAWVYDVVGCLLAPNKRYYSVAHSVAARRVNQMTRVETVVVDATRNMPIHSLHEGLQCGG
jgi:hypothetical protein